MECASTDVQRSAKWIKLSQYNIEIQRNIRKTTNIALIIGRNVEKNISTYREMFEKIKKALGKCGNVPRNIEKAGMLT